MKAFSPFRPPQPLRHRRPGRSSRATAVVVALGVTATSSLLGAGAASAAHDVPVDQDWQEYVLGPGDHDARPVAIVSSSGDVTNPEALAGAAGVTTLTMEEGGPAPVVVLDYGVNVGGIPYFDVSAVSGDPTLRASFSESLRFIDEDGDNGGEGPCCGAAPPAAEPFRWNEFSPEGPGVLRTQYQQGGQRYERLALTAPGSITLTAAGIDFKPFLATPDTFQGHFVSSDETLNRIWYAGAYTQSLNMVPPGAQNNNAFPAMVDGAKRDRAIWAGDLVTQNPSGWVTYGHNGDEYMEDSLRRLALTQRENGIIAGSVRVGPGIEPPFALYYSATYSMHAANTMVDYYRYTGDEAFAREMLPVTRRQLEFDRTLVDDRGLLVTAMGQGSTPPPPICCALDWDAYDPPKIGAVTAYNVVFHRALREAAWLERHLGNEEEAAALEVEAAALAEAINEHLWNAELGLYDLSDTRRGQFAQDANTMAVLWGVAPVERRAGILERVKEELWVPAGVQHFSDNAVGFQHDVLVPFATGFDTAARLAESDTEDALEMYRRHWGLQVDPSTPDYVGSLWEKVDVGGTAVVDDGSNPIDNNSLAHGWSTGPTSQLTEYVLGVRPVDPGYATWIIRPQPAGLEFARGVVPTADGRISVGWTSDVEASLFELHSETPVGTTGTIAVPVVPEATVTVNETVAYDRGTSLALGAVEADGYVHLSVEGGTHHVTVTPDTTAPVVELTGITDGALYGVAGTIDWGVTTDDPRATVVATLDGAPIDPSAPLELWRLELGQHELVVTATDPAGNVTSRTLRFYLKTSLRDVDMLLRHFETAEVVNGRDVVRLRNILFRVRIAEARGNDRAALVHLARFGNQVERRVDDDTAAAALLRSVDAITVELGGTPPGAAPAERSALSGLAVDPSEAGDLMRD